MKASGLIEVVNVSAEWVEICWVPWRWIEMKNDPNVSVD